MTEMMIIIAKSVIIIFAPYKKSIKSHSYTRIHNSRIYIHDGREESQITVLLLLPL